MPICKKGGFQNNIPIITEIRTEREKINPKGKKLRK
jgi:hypothetical protein